MLRLVDGTRMGDGDAFETLGESLRATIRRWARQFTGDSDDAEDVTQIVLMRLHARLDRFRGASSLTSWVYRITRNVATDAQRKAARRSALIAAEAATFATSALPTAQDEDASAIRLAAAIRECYERLPARQREVFRLADLEGQSAVEISRRLGIQPSTVRVTLLKARRAIRARMLAEQQELLEDYRS